MQASVGTRARRRWRRPSPALPGSCQRSTRPTSRDLTQALAPAAAGSPMPGGTGSPGSLGLSQFPGRPAPTAAALGGAFAEQRLRQQVLSAPPCLPVSIAAQPRGQLVKKNKVVCAVGMLAFSQSPGGPEADTGFPAPQRCRPVTAGPRVRLAGCGRTQRRLWTTTCRSEPWSQHHQAEWRGPATRAARGSALLGLGRTRQSQGWVKPSTQRVPQASALLPPKRGRASWKPLAITQPRNRAGGGVPSAAHSGQLRAWPDLHALRGHLRTRVDTWRLPLGSHTFLATSAPREPGLVRARGHRSPGEG